MTSPAATPNQERLTQAEIRIMELYSNPYTEKSAICAELCITLGTLNWHLTNIFSKLGETDRFSASFRFFNQYPEYRKLVDDYIAMAGSR